MFAMPMGQPLQLGDTTYTALAVSYDNAVLEKLLSSMVYEGQSDCYVVRSDGEVVLSTEVKTVIAELMTNLFDYLQQNASVDQPYFDTMVQTLPQGGEGCVLFTMNGQKYYLIYQPVGIMDWGIIGIVPTGVVDAGMRRVQGVTILVIALLGLLIMAGVVKIQRDAERNRRRELEHHREASDMMFAGMARVVERFAVCDLDRDRYQYHERHGEALYPPEGSYRQMLEQISRKYVVLTDSDLVVNLPLDDVLRDHIASGADMTAVCTSLPGPESDTYFQLDNSGRIVDVAHDVFTPEGFRCLNIFVLRRDLLIQLVTDCMAHNQYSFRHNILQDRKDALHFRAYVWDGYAACIDTIESYYRRSCCGRRSAWSCSLPSGPFSPRKTTPPPPIWTAPASTPLSPTAATSRAR